MKNFEYQFITSLTNVIGIPLSPTCRGKLISWNVAQVLVCKVFSLHLTPLTTSWSKKKKKRVEKESTVMRWARATYSAKAWRI